MKRQILILILVAVVSVSQAKPPVQSSGELLCNSSMNLPYENYTGYGDAADCWTPWGWGLFDWGVIDLFNYPSQKIYHSGSGNGFYGPCGIYQNINHLEPGQLYRLSSNMQIDGQILTEFEPGVYVRTTCEYMNQVGVDPTGGTDPYNVPMWSLEYTTGQELGEFYPHWRLATVYFIADRKKATVFTRQTGTVGSQGYSTAMLDWEINCYIDDVKLEPVQIDPQSSVEAVGPVKADGFDLCEVVLTLLDQNGDPLLGIQAKNIDIECSGSENYINMHDYMYSDYNGQLVFGVSSTVAELKTISARVFGVLLPEVQIQFDEPDGWVRFQEISLPYQYSSTHPVVLDTNKAIIGCPDDVGSAEIYSFDGSAWVKEAVLRPSVASDFPYFGSAVDLDGNFAIVTNTRPDYYGSGNGSVYLFEYNGSDWNTHTKLIYPGSANDSFGQSVAIAGDWALVGAPQASSGGAVVVYAHQDSPWADDSILTDPDGTHSEFGSRLALSQEWAAIGADAAVLLYRLENDAWVYDTTLETGGEIEDICLDETRLYVGIKKNDDELMLQRYLYENAQWDLINEWPFDGDSWGYDLSLAFSGPWGIVSQPSGYYDLFNEIVPVVFYHDGNDWIPNASLYPPVTDGLGDYGFGSSVAINENWILISSEGPHCYFLRKY